MGSLIRFELQSDPGDGSKLTASINDKVGNRQGVLLVVLKIKQRVVIRKENLAIGWKERSNTVGTEFEFLEGKRASRSNGTSRRDLIEGHDGG